MVDAPIPLDTSKWEDPTVEFFGTVTKCEFRTTDDAKMKDGRTFTEFRGLPRAIRTWHVEVERMDAAYDLPDGSTAPVTEYMTIDLESLVNGKIIPMTMRRGDNKATYTVNKWAEGGLKLGVTPETAVGKKAQFKLERSHMFSGYVAKKILYPVKLLPEGFQYEGEVSRFTKKERPVDLEEAAAGVEGGSVTAEFDPSILVGLPSEVGAEVNAFIKEHKDLPAEVKTGLVTGELQASLVEDGTLTVEDGLLALP